MSLREKRRKALAWFREFTKKLANSLKKRAREAMPILKAAWTTEKKRLLSAVKKEGLAAMREIADAVINPENRGKKWDEWFKDWLKRHSEAISEDYGGEKRVRQSTVNVIRETLYQIYKDKLTKE